MKTFIKIYCEVRKTKKNGESPVFFMLVTGKRKTLIHSTIDILPDYFDNTKGKVSSGYENSMQLNSFLYKEVTKLQQIVNSLEDSDFLKIHENGNGIDITHKTIIDTYRNYENFSKNIL